MSDPLEINNISGLSLPEIEMVCRSQDERLSRENSFYEITDSTQVCLFSKICKKYRMSEFRFAIIEICQYR